VILNEEQIKTGMSVASSLNIPFDWLNRLIHFESGWNPKAVNQVSGAAGLIQFMDFTAKGLGYFNALDLIAHFPDINSQLLNPVKRYFDYYKPYPTQQSLNMTVFYPAARQWPITTLFPENVRIENPGIKTVQDYMLKVGVSTALNNT
jgi:hypothetical protein